MRASLQQLPASPKFYGVARFSQIIAAGGFPVVGNVTGIANTAAGNVDIACYVNGNKDLLGGSATNVTVSGGTFSVPDVPLNLLFLPPATLCRLRAVPTGTSPADPSPFSGPRVALGGRKENRIAGGPNAGKLYNFFIGSMNLARLYFEAGFPDQAALRLEKVVAKVAQQMGLLVVIERGRAGSTVYNDSSLDLSARVIEEFGKEAH